MLQSGVATIMQHLTPASCESVRRENKLKECKKVRERENGNRGVKRETKNGNKEIKKQKTGIEV